MPVAHLHRTIQDKTTGKLILGATVSLCNPGSETPISASLFSDFAMTQSLPNPYVCSNGIIDVYLPDPVTVQLKVQYGASVDLADRLQILPMAENILVTNFPFGILNAPGTDLVMMGVDTDTVQFAPISTVITEITASALGWFLTQALQFSSIVRDGDGAMLSAIVSWPDGFDGEYTADDVSSMFPGKVDGWHVTRTDGVTTTIFTQPTVTRDTDGNITTMPQVVVT